MRSILLLLTLTALLFGCKSKETPYEVPVESETEVVEIEKDFVEFYEKFHTDSVFQLESINFPLVDPINSITWTTDNWVMHQPFDDYGGKFRREFTPAGKIVLERIYDANGFFDMKRRWAKLLDGYKLIYYSTEEKGME